MNFSSTFVAMVGALADPRPVLRTWRARIDFRRDLARRAGEPHLLRDLGFAPEDAAAEARRAPWEPVRLRRSANPVSRGS